MPTQPPKRRKFDSLDEEEKSRIRANIKKLEDAGVDEGEVEKYLKERENLLRPGDKPTAGERLEEMKAANREGKRKAREAADRKVAIPAVAKTEDGAHILPRMTITQRATPRAKAASAPAMGEEVRAALPAAAKAAKTALREAAPDKLVQGAVRGLARTPTDLVAGAAALGGKKNVRDKALRASERIASVFGEAETPIGEIAEFLPLELSGAMAIPRLVPKSPRIRAPRLGPGRDLASAALTKDEALELALAEDLGREQARKGSGRSLPAGKEPVFFPRQGKTPLLLPERSSGRLEGPAIPMPGAMDPRVTEALPKILNKAEQERRAEKSARLFGGEAPPTPATDLIRVAQMKERSVKDLGKVLTQAGVPKHRRFTDALFEGEAERLHGPGRDRRGAADPELLSTLAGTGVGVVTGAAMNDDPLEGALLGLGLGAVAGGAVGRLTRGGVKFPRSAAMEEVASRIEFGTSSAPLVGPRLRDKVLFALDRWSPLERMGERMDKAGLRPSMNPMHVKDLMMSSGTRVHQALRGEGLVDPDTLQQLGPSLESVFEPIGGGVADVQTAFSYLKALRDEGRLARMGPDAVGGDLSLIQATKDALTGAHPELVAFGQRFKDYTNSLGEYAVRRGLWTPEQWHLIEQSDALYIPFRRMVETIKKGDHLKPSAPRSALTIGSGVKPFTGGHQNVADLADALADYTDALIKRADRYALGQALREGVVEMAAKQGDEWWEVLTPAGGVELKGLKLTEQAVLDALHQQGITGETAELLTDVYTPLMSKDNPILTLNKPGGGKEYWRVNSPELLQTLTHLTPDRSGAGRVIIDALKVAKHVTTATKTGLNPGFAGTNMARDAVDAWGKTRDGVTFAEIGRAWFQVLSGTGAYAPLTGAATGAAIGSQADNPSAITVGAVVGGALGVKLRGRMQGAANKALLHEMETMGGIGNVSIVSREVAPRTSVARFAPTTRWRRFKAVVGELAGKPVEALATITSTSDTFARTAAWKAAVRSKQHLVKSGKWTERDLRYYAATQARGATVDFGRTPGNELLAVAAEIIPFLNAAFQGSLRYGRGWQHSPKRMAMMSSGVALGTMVAWALNERSENPLLINDRPSTERAAFLHVPIPGVDTKISIPLSQENGVVAAGVGYALSHLTENDPNAAARLKESIMRLIPDAYLPGYSEMQDIQENRASFGDRPIETERMERGLPEERKLPTTRPTYTGLARLARVAGDQTGIEGLQNTSPQQAEYMTRGVLGAFADVGADAIGDEVAIAMGEDPAMSEQAPRLASQHPMNPLRSILKPRVPTRSASEDVFYRTLEKMEQSGQSLQNLGVSMAGRPDSASKIQEFLQDPKRGGRLPRTEGGVVDLGFARSQRAMLKEVRDAEFSLLEQWRAGQVDEATYRAETARLREARQRGYRTVLRQLHDAGVTLEGEGRWPQR